MLSQTPQDGFHTLAAVTRERRDLRAASMLHLAALGAQVLGRQAIGFVESDDLGFFGQVEAVGFQFPAYGAVGAGHVDAWYDQWEEAIARGLKYCMHFTNGPTGGSFKVFNGGGSIEVLKSLDDGYSWRVTGYSNVATGAPIVDIVTSPEYGEDTTVCVANEDWVYISDDGGKNFVELDAPWGGDITDMDVTVTDDGDLAILITTDAGELWIKKGLLGWVKRRAA